MHIYASAYICIYLHAYLRISIRNFIQQYTPHTFFPFHARFCVTHPSCAIVTPLVYHAYGQGT